MAMVRLVAGPLLLLDGDLDFVAASDSFSEAFEIDRAHARRAVAVELAGGEWDIPQLRSLLRATVSGAAKIEAYEMDLSGPARSAPPGASMPGDWIYQDPSNAAAAAGRHRRDRGPRRSRRLKEDVLRENPILLQEVRHRVANSLQIIASVLLQNARKMQSDETRSHLKDAHHRVMSVAALERQLAASTRWGDVELRAYFTELCDSIAASMIADHTSSSPWSSLADDSVGTADVSR